MKTIVVIPTYDEKDNVGPMAEAVLKNDVELLFVDDNSPDGTGAVIDELAAKEPRIHVLHREKKEGLGRAYVAGFSKALELGAELVVQMDCDFSHDPKDVARLVEAITTPIPSKKSGNSGEEKKIPRSRHRLAVCSWRLDPRLAFQAPPHFARRRNLHPHSYWNAGKGSNRWLQVLEEDDA